MSDSAASMSVSSFQQCVGGCGVVREGHPRGAHLEGLRGEPGPEPVVQVTPEPPALLFARGHQPLAGALQIGGEARGVRRHAGLPGEVVQQPLVRGENASPGERGDRINCPTGSDPYASGKVMGSSAGSPYCAVVTNSPSSRFRLMAA